MYPYPESLLDAKNLASKRVSRACDRCRLKKTKCDGRRCCSRCLADDAICVFSKRKRSSDRPYSSEYVQLLEDQQTKLVEGVQELYRMLRKGEGWKGPKVSEDSQGYPSVQDVLDALAVLAPSERKGVKQQTKEATSTEHDDEDAQSTSCDTSDAIESVSPPLTPSGSSQSSFTTNSPIDDHPRGNLALAYIPGGYQQPAIKSPPSDQSICPAYPLLHNQALYTDDVHYWSMSSSTGEVSRPAEYLGLADSYTNNQAACNWYPNTYMML